MRGEKRGGVGDKRRGDTGGVEGKRGQGERIGEKRRRYKRRKEERR